MEVKDFVKGGLAAGEFIALVSLDVKSAFDAAWWPGILQELRACGCPKNLYELTKSYFTQRTATLSTNSVRLESEISKVCPQGSCCGPGFWNLQYKSLLNLKFKTRTKVVAFAVDIILAIRGESVRAVENYSNVDLSKITLWAQNNKILFNEEKSKLVLASRRKRREQKEIKVYLNNKPLEQVVGMRYLGIIMDHKFRFQDHIYYAAEKCTKLIYNLSKMAKLSWGIKHAAIETIYKGAILPLLTYGAPVWIDAMKYEHNRRKYIRVQGLINIRMAKADRTTSSEALCILTGNTPIIIKIEEAVKLYNIKKRMVSPTLVLDMDVEFQYWPHPADAVTITEVAGNEKASVHTDGSKHEHGVGSGPAIFMGSEVVAQLKLRLDNRCSNNQAEQLAIVKALEAIESMHNADISPRTATIFTDSRVTLDSLRNVNKHAYLAEEIRKRVASLESRAGKVTFSWVKAHVGIYGNELADRLAKEAARSSGTSIAFNRIPESTLYYDAAEEAKQKWQDEWTACAKADIKKQYFPTVRDRLKVKINLTTKLSAMLTGHGRKRAYLLLFKLRDDATCICGQDDQTMNHLLNHCTMLHAQREMLKHYILRRENWPTSKQELIMN
jgi:ribonuclease HI